MFCLVIYSRTSESITFSSCHDIPAGKLPCQPQKAIDVSGSTTG